jgi:hypothetical protein
MDLVTNCTAGAFIEAVRARSTRTKNSTANRRMLALVRIRLELAVSMLTCLLTIHFAFLNPIWTLTAPRKHHNSAVSQTGPVPSSQKGPNLRPPSNSGVIDTVMGALPKMDGSRYSGSLHQLVGASGSNITSEDVLDASQKASAVSGCIARLLSWGSPRWSH